MMFKNIRKQLQNEYGKMPNTLYHDGEMKEIRTHYEFRRENRLDEFLIDDITWHDLLMDDLFKRINLRLTTSGEQYLYYLLRSPTLKEEEYEKRRKLIKNMEEKADFRLSLQVIFAKLGRRRNVALHKNFVPTSSKYGKLCLYLSLVLALLISLIGALLNYQLLSLLLIALLIFIPSYHYFEFKKIEFELQRINYIVSMVTAAKRIKKLKPSGIETSLNLFYESLERLKSINGIAFSIREKGTAQDEFTLVMTFLFNNFFLLDLIAYEWLKNKFGKHHQAIFNLHETIGELEASIAIASYRQSLNHYSLPVIHFDKEGDIALRITEMAHPLVKEPVLNSIDTQNSILLTGSNASGKSTFLRSVALNMIMAQSICTVLAKDYEAPAFYIYSSIAIGDDLLAGDSYFIAEIKSMKRIVDAISTTRPVFCVIDEILRGTNTVERISASSELLKRMANEGTLCFAATHDIELCELLKQDYRMLHFTESITESGEVSFDYKMKEGPATSRNAIKLLETLGFDQTLIQSANTRANLYSEHGKWVED